MVQALPRAAQRLALAALVSLTSSGCVYLQHRGRDLRDIFVADVGLGVGLGVDFQVTDAVHSGLGGGLTAKVGLRKPNLQHLSSGYSAFESTEAFVLYRSSSPVEGSLYQGHLWNALYWGDYFGDEPHGRDWSGRQTELPLSMNRRAPWLNLLDVDVGIIVLPIAARVGFSPGETLDFILGWFGLDIGSDDDRTLPGSATHDPLLPVNPSFDLTMEAAVAMLEEMRADPRDLERPVVILGGLMDPGLNRFWVRDLSTMVSAKQPIISVSFATNVTFDACRARVLAAVDEALPGDDPLWTQEVDVIAMSMGGLVARHSAAEALPEASSQRRLKIARLFTISTPHRGAEMAMIPNVLPVARDMRPKSKLIRRLAELHPSADYELFPYVRSTDFIVGAANAAPVGETAWWLANPPFQSAHIGAMMDARFQADIVRRLRGEAPIATLPRAPLPD